MVRDHVRDGAAVTARVRSRARAAAGVLLAAALLSSCSKLATGDGSGDAVSSASPATSSTAATETTAAVKALESSARQVRSQVDSLAAPLLARATKRQITVDDAGSCQIGVDNQWPQRWGYAVMVTLASTDPVLPSQSLQILLKGQGWTIRPHGSTSDSLDFDARRDGVVLRISGEPNPSTVTIEGYGTCVGVDGNPVDGNPVDGNPVDGNPVDGNPVDGTTVDGTPVDGTPVDGTTVDGTTVDGTPAAGTPVDGTPTP